MKSGTIARIATYGLVIVAVLGLLFPVISAMNDSEDLQVGLGVKCIYDLEDSTPDALADNVRDAVGEDSGYELVYGSERRTITSKNIDEICLAAKLSGEKRATVYEPDGSVAVQQAIIYVNEMFTTVVTGFLVPGMTEMPVNIDMNTGIADLDNNVVFRGNYESTVDDDGFYLELETPTIPLIVAMAAGYHQCIIANTGMEKIFAADVQLTINQNDDIKCEISENMLGIKTMSFKTSACGLSAGTVGDVKFISDGHSLNFVYEGVLSEKLETLASQGPVTIKAALGDSYEMSSDDAMGLAGMLRVLEAQA